MNGALEILIAGLVLLGCGFVLVGSLGLLRLRDVYARLHGPTKATTLGLGAILIASMLNNARLGAFSIRETAIALFLMIAAPLAANLIAKTVDSVHNAPDRPAGD